MIIENPLGFSAVTTLRLHTDRALTSAAIRVPLTARRDGRYTADVDDVPDNRYWGALEGTRWDGDTGTYRILEPIDLPIDERLIVSPQALAAAAGLPLPLNDTLAGILTSAILDAQADVRAYLGQPITPTLQIQTGCWPYAEGWRLTVHGDARLGDIVSVTSETGPDGITPTGYYTIRYLAGLNARTDPDLEPIRRYVKAHALAAPEVGRYWQTTTKAKGAVTNISADGQSISFKPATLGSETPGKPGDGAPGSLPTLSSLDYWRVAGRRVHVAEQRSGYDDSPGWWIR